MMSTHSFTVRWRDVGKSDTLIMPAIWMSDGKRQPELVGMKREHKPAKGQWVFRFLGNFKRRQPGPARTEERVCHAKYRDGWLAKWLPRFRRLAARRGEQFHHVEGML